MLKTDHEFPFCSERCRVIDLGKWASGGYVISEPVSDAELYGYGTGSTNSDSTAERRQMPDKDLTQRSRR